MKHASPENLGYLLGRATDVWNERLETAFAEAGVEDVDAAHGAVLVPLFDEDCQSIGDIQSASGLTKQTLTSHVRELTRQGLVEKRRDPDDGRRTILQLTDAGRERKRVSDRVVTSVNEEVLSHVEPGDREALYRALEAIAESA